jgi:hypothetical protein
MTDRQTPVREWKKERHFELGRMNLTVHGPQTPRSHTVLTANENVLATSTHIPKTSQQAANSALPIPTPSALAALTFHNAFRTTQKTPITRKAIKVANRVLPIPKHSTLATSTFPNASAGWTRWRYMRVFCKLVLEWMVMQVLPWWLCWARTLHFCRQL